MTPYSNSGRNKWPGYTILAWISCFLVVNPISAGTIISSGTMMNVLSGTMVSCNSDMMLNDGGTLTNQGTIVLKGNLQNNNASLNPLGPGTIQFSGTTGQTISGPNQFGNVVINNSYGVTVTDAADNEIDGSLTLSTGLLVLGARNLLLSASSVVSSTPAPSASNMVVTADTGQLQKRFSGNGSFTFPIGDNTGTAEYSPLTLQFSAGTYTTVSYAGVNVVNAKCPDTNIKGDYLKRYWKIKQNGITGFTCNATFKYMAADIVGWHKNIYCIKDVPLVTYNKADTTNKLLTANGLTSFSIFTGSDGGLSSNLAAFLEGPMSGSVMTTTLNTAGWIPHNQPYNISPWSYQGTEHLNPIPSGVTDWVEIELRQATDPSLASASTIFGKRAAFLKSNGQIVDLDGTNNVKFYNSVPAPGKNVYIVIKHRNHLAIMSSGAVPQSGGIYTWDFRTIGSNTYGYPDGIKLVGSNYCMVAGNGYPDADINVNDFSFSYFPQFGNFDGYYSGDFNLNGEVEVNDFSFYYFANYGAFGNITDKPVHGYHSCVP